MFDLGRVQRSIPHTENLWAILQESVNELQTVPNVVPFVGGVRRAQNKRSIPTTRKLTPVDPRNVTFWKFTGALFWKFWFDKIRHLFALLALQAMSREGHGKIAYQTLHNFVLRNASLVTKSCIAQFFDDEACNPSALSDCSRGE